MLDATLNGGILVDHKINLNDYTTSSLTLDVISCDDELDDSPWYVSAASAVGEDAVSFKKIYGNKLKININFDEFKSSSFFMLGNVNGDILRINVEPNTKSSAIKRYSFRVRKPNISFDNAKKEIVIDKITSSVNGEKLKWTVSGDGFPLKYEISTEPNKCVIRLLSDVVGEFTSNIILTQEKSSKRLVIAIYYVLDEDGKSIISKVETFTS